MNGEVEASVSREYKKDRLKIRMVLTKRLFHSIASIQYQYR